MKRRRRVPENHPLKNAINAAKTELARLERMALIATCDEVGHDMAHIGNRNASCHPDCACSIPVHECRRCKGCDYGENSEAKRIVESCEFQEQFEPGEI